jgi:broad specificity phosphatase PhoE
LKPIIDSSLDEIDTGRVGGFSDQDIMKRYPEIWRAYQKESDDFRWPGGETGAETQARVLHFLARRGTGDTGKSAVAHDGIIRLLVCHVLAIPVFRRFSIRLDTAGIVEIYMEEGSNKWVLVRMNQVLK